MTITELALLHLAPNVTTRTPALASALSHAKTAMQTYTNNIFYYMQQVEDPSYIYIVGEWASFDDHLNGFIPSDANQAVLDSLKDLATVELLEHLNVPHADLPLPHTGNVENKTKGGDKCGDMVTYSITRHFVKNGERAEFERAFEENKDLLQDFVTLGKIGGGWRIDEEEGKEEFVLFIPWKNVGQHEAFGKSEAFEKYARIREFITGAEIKHAKIVEF